MDDSKKRIESLTANLLECYEELDLIHRLSRDLMSTLDATRSVEMVLKEAVEIFDADLGCVLPLDAVHAPFPARHHNADPSQVAALCDVLIGTLMAERRSRIVYSVADELGIHGTGMPHSLMCAVLQTESTVYGALCVGRRAGAPDFTAGELKLANTLASQATIAVENSVLHRRRLEEEQEIIRMQEELRLAREIQTRLLPSRVPTVKGYDIAGRSIPAQSIGGDYFDLIPTDDGRIALCLGDVSGKGLPASILMSHLQASIRGQTLMNASPKACLTLSNRLLFHSTAVEKFATCFYGILDPREHRLQFSNAGHDHPMLTDGNGSSTRLDNGGMVLGIFEDAGYDEYSVVFPPGGTLVIYSDGIPDAANAADEEFGLDRLTRLIMNCGSASAETLVQSIVNDVVSHADGAPQTDDMTLVVVRRCD